MGHEQEKWFRCYFKWRSQWSSGRRPRLKLHLNNSVRLSRSNYYLALSFLDSWSNLGNCSESWTRFFSWRVERGRKAGIKHLGRERMSYRWWTFACWRSSFPSKAIPESPTGHRSLLFLQLGFFSPHSIRECREQEDTSRTLSLPGAKGLQAVLPQL